MQRRHFLQTLVLGTAALGARPPHARAFRGPRLAHERFRNQPLEPGFSALAGQIPRPRAILSVSAHWYVDGTWLTGQEEPRTIHDFGGFPRALYEVQYPASGQPDLARQISGWLEAWETRPEMSWGLDHGTWSVLRWMYPDARIPVLQLSINHRLKPEQHLELARSLRDLRHQGVLVMGSATSCITCATPSGACGRRIPPPRTGPSVSTPPCGRPRWKPTRGGW